MSLSTVEKFTQREQEVAQLLIMGLYCTEIGDKLNISKHTAKSHISNIISKLGAANRTHAAYLLGIQKFYDIVSPNFKNLIIGSELHNAMYRILFPLIVAMNKSYDLEDLYFINKSLFESTENMVKLVNKIIEDIDILMSR